MNARQYAALESKIQEWMDSECEHGDWVGLDVIVGQKTVAMMASAARLVLEACEESQDYAKREGYLRDNMGKA